MRPLPLPEDHGPEIEALRRAVLDLTAQAIALSQASGVSIEQLAAQAQDPLMLAYLIGSMLSLDVPREQALLEAPTRLEALQLLHGYLAHELRVLELRQKIASQAQTEMSKEQRDYMLRQQLRAIQQELGEKNPESQEAEELRRRFDEADLPEEVRKEVEREPAAAGTAAHGRARLPDHPDLSRAGPRAPLAPRHRRRHRPEARSDRCSTRTITTSRRSRSGSSSTWPC